jgi:hypothetical protein
MASATANRYVNDAASRKPKSVWRFLAGQDMLPRNKDSSRKKGH